MRFWELGNKDVINCKNGHRLGCVGDLEIDVCRFCITDIYVPTGGKYCGCIGKMCIRDRLTMGGYKIAQKWIGFN